MTVSSNSRAIVSLVATVLAICISGHCATASPEALKAYRSGMKLWGDKDLNGAIESLSASIVSDDKFIPALIARCQVYLEKKWYLVAESDCSRVVYLDPKNHLGYKLLGDVTSNIPNTKTAISAYSDAIRLKSNDAKAFIGRGRVFYSLGILDRSKDDINAALSRNPNDYEALELRGDLYSLHDSNQSIKDYTRSIDLGNKNSAIFEKRSAAYEASGDLSRTLDDLESANKYGNESSKILEHIADIQVKLGRNYPSILTLNKAIKADWKNGGLLIKRAQVWSKLDQYAQASRDYDAAIQLDSSFKPDVEKGRALIFEIRTRLASKSIESSKDYLLNGRYMESITAADEAVRISEGSEAALKQRAKSHMAIRSFIPAIKDLSRLIVLGSLDQDAFYLRAICYRETGDLISSRADLDYLITNNMSSWKYRKERAGIFAAMKEFGLASEDLSEASKLNRDLTNDTEFLSLRRSVLNGTLSEATSQPRNSVGVASEAPPAVIAAVQAAPVVSTPAVSNLAAVPETRVALVIGNGAYANADRLDNPTRDAAAVARALREAGFKTVRLKSDLRYDELRTALRDFAADSEHADWAVVYYAGHGMEVSGTNYLLPVDAQLKTDRTIGSEAIPLEQVLTSIGGARKLRLVILDACRDNPLAQRMTRTFASRSSSSGLAQVELSDSGTMVAFAAKHGQQAADGVSGQANSPFAAALIDNIAKPGVDIRRMFGRVRDQVMTATRKQQEPYTYGSLGGDEFLFKPE